MKPILFVPINLASESQRRFGQDVWKFSLDRDQEGWKAAHAFLNTHGFPERVPLAQVGRLILVLGQAGYNVEFMASAKKLSVTR
jgi:hypothetical protein